MAESAGGAGLVGGVGGGVGGGAAAGSVGVEPVLEVEEVPLQPAVVAVVGGGGSGGDRPSGGGGRRRPVADGQRTDGAYRGSLDAC